MSQLPQRRLGASAWRASVLGLGCASYWAHPRFPEDRARSVLERALTLGVNFYDTGASYAGGLAERRLGRLLGELGRDPHELLIATKIGTLMDAHGRRIRDFRPDSMADQLTASLDRLGMERVALLQLHGPRPEELSDELLSALERQRHLGRVALLGINGSDASIARAVESGIFDVVMPFVSVLKPQGRPTARVAAAADIGVVAAEPLGRMLFAPPLRKWLTSASGVWYLARALSNGPRALTAGRQLRRVLRAPDWSPAQLALKWVLEQPGMASAVVGSTNPAHLSELARAVERPMPEQVSRALDELLGEGDATA